jgi:hypothetical protein
MILTISDFVEYNNLVIDDTIQNKTLNGVLGYAQGVVESYLNYPIEVKTYSEVVQGLGTYLLRFINIPVRMCLSVKPLNGNYFDNNLFAVYDKGILYTDYATIFDSDSLFVVTYIAGYGIIEGKVDPSIIYNPNFYDVIPDDIYMVTLDIASVIWAGHGQNAGVTGRLDEFGNKTFVQLNNFDKYLQRIKRYRNVI